MGTSARDTFVGSSFHYHEYKGDKEISMRLVMTRIKDQRLLLRSLFCPAFCPAAWEPQLLMPRLTPSCWLPPLLVLTTQLCTPSTENVCTTETVETEEIEYEKVCKE